MRYNLSKLRWRRRELATERAIERLKVSISDGACDLGHGAVSVLQQVHCSIKPDTVDILFNRAAYFVPESA